MITRANIQPTSATANQGRQSEKYCGKNRKNELEIGTRNKNYQLLLTYM